eukprot:5265-Heterococcus_DN1.PRE.22
MSSLDTSSIFLLIACSSTSVSVTFIANAAKSSAILPWAVLSQSTAWKITAEFWSKYHANVRIKGNINDTRTNSLLNVPLRTVHLAVDEDNNSVAIKAINLKLIKQQKLNQQVKREIHIKKL